jgi:hypothetical protein
MPVSIRKSMVVAVFVGGLSAGVGIAVGVGPAPAAAAAPITVAVVPNSSASPGYRIRVRNDGGDTVATTLRQQLPPGAAALAISDGGQAAANGGRGAAGGNEVPVAGQAAPTGPPRGVTEITWQLHLQPRSTMTLTTTIAAAPGAAKLTAPACAFADGQDMPYDCASATWDAARVRPAGPGPTPWWRTPAFLGGAPAALVVIAALAWLWRALRQRRKKLRRAESRQRSGAAVYDPQAARGTLYPRPAAPRLVLRRRRPPVWLVVSAAAVILGGVVFAATWTATSRVSAIRADRQPTSGAWVGPGSVGPVGAPLRESAFEFTVYRLACPPSGTSAVHQCRATVGLHNITPKSQPWYGALQRAYQPGGTWVPTDEAATRTANGGRDLFADPVPPGARRLFPLVFTLSESEPPTQIELRSAVFSAGVRVNV